MKHWKHTVAILLTLCLIGGGTALAQDEWQLCSPEEVKCYVEMQKDYQHRVLICDRDDFAVMEIVEGKLVFPDEQTLREYLEGQEPGGGMAMT